MPLTTLARTLGYFPVCQITPFVKLPVRVSNHKQNVLTTAGVEPATSCSVDRCSVH